MSRSGSTDGAWIAQRTCRLPAVGPTIARRFRFARLALALFLVAGATGAYAASAESPFASDPRDRTALQSRDDRWRARGAAFVDLPFGLRARYEAQALNRLTAPFAELPAGATRRSARLIESRFALSRAIAPHLELELAWTARSPLSRVDLLRIEDQRLAAMIRFVP